MSVIYQYSLGSFSNGINLDKLTDEVNNSSITVLMESINKDSSFVKFFFASTLSGAEQTTLNTIVATHDGTPPVYNENDINYYLNTSAIVTDPTTSISGPFSIMQPLINRREIFNDTDNPVYDPNTTPLLGSGGSVQLLYNIHDKLGWHNQMIVQSRFTRPKDVLVYYGWMNSFNSGTNVWNNEKVSQDMAKYKILVLGDGIQNPGHGDYSNTEVIIPRIKSLNSSALIFGYVSVNQSYANFQTKVDQWNTLGVHGIMMDEAGYDYGDVSTNGRAAFNQKVDYVHGKSSANICFPNAWNTDHILGTANDPTYPNSTWNSSAIESNLTENDWIMLESFPVNTTAYSGNGGYETAGDWSARGSKANTLRVTYGCNFACINMINNDNVNGQDLFDFAFTSCMIWSFEGFGTSDSLYGASSATVTYWSRTDVSSMGLVYTVNPDIQQDLNDSDVWHRYCELAKMSLDFSASAQTSSITKF